MARPKQFKAPEYVHFVYARGTNAHYGFSTYTDHVGALGKPGAPVFVAYQLNDKGKPVPYQFSFSVRDRTLRVQKDKVDMNGVNVADFLKNHPECKDSPNGTYIMLPNGEEEQVNIFFKVMDEETDAKKALEAKSYRIQAENLAASLELVDVYDINALCGIFKEGELMNRHAIMELAGNRPDVFMDAYNNPNRKALALIRKGISKNILTQQGTVVIFNKTTLGLDELDAAAKIQKEPKMMLALEEALKRV